MSDNLNELPEPVRFEAAKSELTAFMGDLQRELGLSDTAALSVMDCVVGEQRARLCALLAQQAVAYANTLFKAVAEKEPETKE